MFKFSAILLLAFFAIATAFSAFPAATKPARMVMLQINLGNKPLLPVKKIVTPPVTPKTIKELSQNQGQPYIPDGLSPQEYAKFVAEEAAKKSANVKKVQSKPSESLTEWLDKNAEKGLVGRELNKKGHRFPKFKYDGWFTSRSPF
eukprot:gene9371-10347_t